MNGNDQRQDYGKNINYGTFVWNCFHLTLFPLEVPRQSAYKSDVSEWNSLRLGMTLGLDLFSEYLSATMNSKSVSMVGACDGKSGVCLDVIVVFPYRVLVTDMGISLFQARQDRTAAVWVHVEIPPEWRRADAYDWSPVIRRESKYFFSLEKGKAFLGLWLPDRFLAQEQRTSFVVNVVRRDGARNLAHASPCSSDLLTYCCVLYFVCIFCCSI
jgi:hypothetical protein